MQVLGKSQQTLIITVGLRKGIANPKQGYQKIYSGVGLLKDSFPINWL
jgi:hypothetical protein